MTALAPELTMTTGTAKARVGARPGTPGRRVVRPGPVGKPGNCPAPDLSRSAVVGARGCAVAGDRAAASPAPAEWRLTDRGIAVVLTLAVLLGVAAMVCIGLRAAEVTSADYQPTAASQVR